MIPARPLTPANADAPSPSGAKTATGALPWPLPALLAWALAWGSFFAAMRLGVTPMLAAALAAVVGAGCALSTDNRWRRLLIGGGFPASLLASGLAASWPAWTWLLPLAALALLYPRRAWRDAPLFPTPAGTLAKLPRHLPLPASARVLDAGCGLGDGLMELRRAYPQADLHGLEWSWPLRWVAALRCRWARVRRGDIWAEPWTAYRLVYLFQRPESMPLAWAKACAEMSPGAWLVSLEFPVPDAEPAFVLQDGARPVWAYCVQSGDARS